MIDPVTAERIKYEEMWGIQDYRTAHSPGVVNFSRFTELVEPKPGYSLIDIGCGAGQAGLMLRDLGLQVTWMDLTDMALLPEVPRDRFIEQSVWELRGWWDYGYCCDVMEHLPTEWVMLALDRITHSCALSYFSIALRPDVFGQVIGQPLHLTVRHFSWWRDRLASVSNVLEARDLCQDGLFVCSRD